MKKNKYGLTRTIPSPTKRTVRKECLFGCVLCGNAICEYDHITPFVDVRDHLVSDIALLCGDCHAKKTRGLISAQQVSAARAKPFRLDNPWPSLNIKPEYGLPVKIGGAEFINARGILRVLNNTLFEIKDPEEDSAPPRISALFFDSSGKECLRIEDNECVFIDNAWDIEFFGPTLTIREGYKKVAIRIRMSPDKIIVDRMKMHYLGIDIQASEKWLQIGKQSNRFKIAGMAYKPEVAIEIRDKPQPTVGDLKNGKTSRRQINIHGQGGDYRIGGSQPKNSEINFSGGAKSLTIDGDVSVTVGASFSPQYALSQGVAMSLENDENIILIGKGSRKSSISID